MSAARVASIQAAYDATLAQYTQVLADSAAASAAYSAAIADWAPSYSVDGQAVDMSGGLAALAQQKSALALEARSLSETLARLRRELADEDGPFEFRTQIFSP